MQPPAAHWSASNWLKSHPQRLVLIGASVRAAAQSAQRAGFLVTGIDLFGDTDSRAACERLFYLGEESLESDVATHDAGLPSLIVGGTSDHRAQVQHLQSLCPELQPRGPSHEPAKSDAEIASVDRCWDDPTWLRHVAEQAGAMFPETRLSPPCNTKSSEQRGRWLVKEIGGSGGLGIQWHVEGQHVSTQLTDNRNHEPAVAIGALEDRSFIHQRWVPGHAIGVTYLMDGQQSKLVGTCRSLWKRQTKFPFVYGGSVGPIPLPKTLTQTLDRLGEIVVTETNASGLINADLIIDRQDRPWLLEFNPRWSGSCEVLERALRDQQATRSLFRDHVDARLGSLPAASCPDGDAMLQSLWIKRIVFARHDLRFHFDDAQRVLSDDVTLHDIPSDGTQIRQGEPVCTMLQAVKRALRSDPSCGHPTLGCIDKKNPMREHRVQVCRLHDALSKHRDDGVRAD